VNGPLVRMSLAVVATMALAACAQSPAASPEATKAPAVAVASPTVAPTPAPTPRPSPTARATPVIVTVTPIPDAPDSGIVVQVVAKNYRWAPNELAAPAGAVWHVALDNQDPAAEVHNFVVASGPRLEERIFTSERFYGGTIAEFAVPALPAGAYLFICTLHAREMTGQLTVK